MTCFIVSMQILHISKYLSLKFDMTLHCNMVFSQKTPLSAWKATITLLMFFT